MSMRFESWREECDKYDSLTVSRSKLGGILERSAVEQASMALQLMQRAWPFIHEDSDVAVLVFARMKTNYNGLGMCLDGYQVDPKKTEQVTEFDDRLIAVSLVLKQALSDPIYATDIAQTFPEHLDSLADSRLATRHPNIVRIDARIKKGENNG